MGEVWAVASGKGGVGKSTFALCAALTLTQRGKRVMLLDADVGARNLDMMLGIENKVFYDLLDVISGEASLEQATLRIKKYANLSLLFAPQTCMQDALAPEELLPLLLQLKILYDVVIIDCPTGTNRLTYTLLMACERPIIVTVPEDISMRDADHLIGLLAKGHGPHPYLVSNRVKKHCLDNGEMYPGKTVAQVLDATFLGEIPEDEAVLRRANYRKAANEGNDLAAQAFDGCIACLLGERKAFILSAQAEW